MRRSELEHLMRIESLPIFAAKIEQLSAWVSARMTER